jgi:two-component system cell cycle response regulator
MGEGAPMDILVINADMLAQSVIQQVFKHSSHKVTYQQSFQDAWQQIVENGYRMIIADATSSQQAVQHFIKQVHENRERLGKIYILLLTNKGQNGNLIENLGTGADDYLSTPIIPHELKARVTVGERILTMGTELTRARDQMENLAMYDTLTGLMNRQAFYKVAEGELERARRIALGMIVIAIDINNFKAINQQHGHAIGDEVLQIVAQIIREKCRPYDCIGRWENDKFMIALPGLISADAEKIVTRILAGVQSTQISLMDGSSLELRLSAGIAAAMNINAYVEIEAFLQSALQAMLNSKQEGEEQIVVNYL